MRLLTIIAIALLALGFAVVNGVLMCVSPKHHGAFWRWYTRSGNQAVGVESGAQIQLRLAGLIIVVSSMFFGWILAEKILSR
ncbi:MAG: hypothetical protein ACREAC_01815 [Blastocatellia bacterium]